jgi:hypothetical protein
MNIQNQNQRPEINRQTPAWLFAVLLVMLGLGFAGPGKLQAQNFAIDWFTIDGGGGTSTGGVYTVSGTIGQPDAGRMSGGNYTIDGGFWGIIAAIQTPGSPLLRVVLTTTNTVVVAWPSPSTGFSLQQNPAVNNGVTWSAVTNVPAVVGSEKQVIIAPPLGNKYYRLLNP